MGGKIARIRAMVAEWEKRGIPVEVIGETADKIIGGKKNGKGKKDK